MNQCPYPDCFLNKPSNTECPYRDICEYHKSVQTPEPPHGSTLCMNDGHATVDKFAYAEATG